jgi:hypothetical protein
MTSKHFFTLALIGGALALGSLAGVGCGGGNNNTAAAGSGGSSTHTSSHTTGHTTSSSGTGGTGGGSTSNNSFDTAAPIMVDATMLTPGTLKDASATADYYTFMGTKGDKLVMVALAQQIVKLSSTHPNYFDPTITDTYLNLYDANKKLVAGDNDQWPHDSTDSQLFVELPATGQYYLVVEDCNTYGATHMSVQCSYDNKMISTFDYEVGVFHTNKVNIPEVVGNASMTGTVTYKLPAMATAGNYGFYDLDGNFGAAGEKHVFALTPPADTNIVAGQRGRAEFWIQPIGADNGDGSTANVKAWVTDDMAGTHILGRLDENNFSQGNDLLNGPMNLSIPIAKNMATMMFPTYYLWVQNTAATSNPSSDYYFIQHWIGVFDIGYAEDNTMPHGTSATAQALKPPSATDNKRFGVDGDIGVAGTEQDWYQVAVPGGTSVLFAECLTGRVGAGLVGFRADIYGSDAMTTLLTLGPETANATTNLNNFFTTTTTMIGSNTKLFMKLTAASQDPMNTGTDYRCFVFFQ